MSQRPKGLLIAFEGLDQSGKQTQAEGLRDHLIDRAAANASSCRFPTTRRRSAARSRAALHGERDYGPDVMQLLYVANRHEKKPEIERALGAGTTSSAIATSPRASPTAKRRGSTRWLTDIQRSFRRRT